MSFVAIGNKDEINTVVIVWCARGGRLPLLCLYEGRNSREEELLVTVLCTKPRVKTSRTSCHVPASASPETLIVVAMLQTSHQLLVIAY